MGNEGCSYPSVKCKKRVSILVEGGEIELSDGEVSASLSPLSLCPLIPLFVRSVYPVSFRTVLVERAVTVEHEVQRCQLVLGVEQLTDQYGQCEPIVVPVWAYVWEMLS